MKPLKHLRFFFNFFPLLKNVLKKLLKETERLYSPYILTNILEEYGFKTMIKNYGFRYSVDGVILFD